MRDLATLTAADFAPLRGQAVRLVLGDGTSFELTLAEVSGSAEGGAARAPFSVLYRGGPAQALPQGIYRLEDATLGTLELFLVPLGPDADGQRYEAVFA